MILFFLLTMYSAPSFMEYSAILELLCQMPVGRTDTQALGDITIITFLLHPFQLAYYTTLLCTHRATDKDGHCGVNGTDMFLFFLGGTGALCKQQEQRPAQPIYHSV